MGLAKIAKKADRHKLLAFLLLQGTSVFDLKLDEHLKNLKSAAPLLEAPDLYIFVEYFFKIPSGTVLCNKLTCLHWLVSRSHLDCVPQAPPPTPPPPHPRSAS